jgi:uncharacterized protein YkwD
MVAPTLTGGGSVAKPSEASAYQSRILVLVNAERTKAHLRPLSLVACADGYADSWSANIARTGNLVHQNLGPLVNGCQASNAGENIATGHVTADAMMTMWMNSPGHRANILNPIYTNIGVGATKTSAGAWYGVQDFVTR